MNFYGLLFVILDSKWRFFYPVGVLVTMENLGNFGNSGNSGNFGNSGNSENFGNFGNSENFGNSGNFEAANEINHKDEFLGIFKAFCFCFENPELELAKEILRFFRILNEKWGLFRKKIFPAEILAPILRAFFEILVKGSHDLLIDEILDSASSMITATGKSQNFFYQEFLPEFLLKFSNLAPDQISTLLNNFKRESSQPSLAIELQKLVGEIKLYQLCNTSAF